MKLFNIFKRRERNFLGAFYWEKDGKSGFKNIQFTGYDKSGYLVITELMKILEKEYDEIVLISIVNIDNIMSNIPTIEEPLKEQEEYID
jgi:hypothetical protein